MDWHGRLCHVTFSKLQMVFHNFHHLLRLLNSFNHVSNSKDEVSSYQDMHLSGIILENSNPWIETANCLSTTNLISHGPGSYSAYVSVIRKLVVRPTSILLALTIHSLSACDYLAPTSTTDWFTKGHIMCYHVYVIMRVKDPNQSVFRVGQRPYIAYMCWTGMSI